MPIKKAVSVPTPRATHGPSRGGAAVVHTERHVAPAFEKFREGAYPFRYAGTMVVDQIAGGTPSDKRVAESWLKTKLGADKDDTIRELVAKTMLERGIDADAATAEVNILQHLNGFKRDENGLYIEGRQLKAGIKEAVNVAVAAGKLTKRGWGTTNKSLLGYLAEHVFVQEKRLYLGVTDEEFKADVDSDDPEARCGIMQRFVSTFRGTGIQYEEYVREAVIDFTVEADHEFSEQEWATIWLVGEKQGIGASRSQGFGTYTITSWEQEV